MGSGFIANRPSSESSVLSVPSGVLYNEETLGDEAIDDMGADATGLGLNVGITLGNWKKNI
jgi:hypothetical protein